MSNQQALPLVSIGFLTYNHFVHLDQSIFIGAIESLLKQDYANKELVIFDDCSTDGTYEMCQKYAEQYPFIKLQRNIENLGAIGNLEKLLANINGDFFFWACPDDQYASNYISMCVEQFNNNSNAIVVLTGTKVTYDNGDIRHFRYNDFSIRFPLRKHIRNVLQSRDYLGNNVLYPPAVHSAMVKSAYTSKLYCRDEFFGLEEAWFLNGLIWGDVDYIDKFLYYRKALSLPYLVKNPEAYDKFSNRNIYLISSWKYVKYFCVKSDIAFSKKTKYFCIAVLFVWYRVLPYLKANLKVSLFHFFNKLGIMRCADQKTNFKSDK